MAPRRKLRANEQDETAAQFDSEDFRRHWVSCEHGSSRNTSKNVVFNQQDNGFQHLNIPTPEVQIYIDIVGPPVAFKTFDAQQEAAYLSAIQAKLSLAKSYIEKEKEIGLDPDRPGIHKEPTAVLLGEGPIVIDMSTQQLIRLLIDSGDELKKRIGELEGETTEEAERVMDGLMREYCMFYSSLLERLVWQIPGKDDEDKMARADSIVERVLGKLVEA